METIKKILSPGKGNDEDANTYQPSKGLSGERSHFGSTKETSSALGGEGSHFGSTPQGTGAHSSTTSGPHSSNFANKGDPRVDSDKSRLGGETSGIGEQAAAGGYTSTSGGSYHTGPSGTAVTSGTYNTDTAKLLDPASGAGTSVGLEDAHKHTEAGGGAEEADRHHQAGGDSVAEQYRVGPGQEGMDGRAGDSSIQSGTSGSHLGRNAAIGAGGAGAAGLALREHKKNQTESGSGSSNVLALHENSGIPDSSRGVGLRAGAAGTYDSNTDAMPGAFPGQGNSTLGSSTHQPGTANYPIQSGVQEGNSSKDQHHGRNAAVASGVAAGIGGAGYVASRRADNSPASSEKPYDFNLLNLGDRKVESDHSKGSSVTTGGAGYGTSGQTQPHSVTTTTTTTSQPTITTTTNQYSTPDTSKDHNYARDGALVGAGAGTGLYAGNKLRSDKNKETAGPHSSDLTNKADPRVDSDHSKEQDKKETHHARDAAIAGGTAGAVGYGAHEYNKHDEKELKKAEKEAEKERKHEEKEREKDHKKAEKEAEKERKHADKEHKKAEKEAEKNEKKEHKGLLSFLHRDKNKKYTKEEEEEFDRQEREHESNKAGNPTLGTGAAATGGAAYAAHEKHSDTTNTGHHGPVPEAEKPAGTTIGDKLHGTERNRGIPGSSGFVDGVEERDEHGNPIRGSVSEHPAGGAIQKEAGHHGPIPEAEKPAGTTIGDKLHGVARNRGVPGPTGFIDGIEEKDQFGNPVRGSFSGQGGVDRQHDGNAAGLGLGAGSGAGALGANTHRAQQVNAAADSTHYGSSQTHHHDTTAKDLNYIPASTSTSTSTQQPTQHYNIPRAVGEHDTTQDGTPYTSSGGRNKLHKDPPTGHPASGTSGDHVPSSGAEREQLVGQGQRNLDDKSGVAHSERRHGESGY